MKNKIIIVAIAMMIAVAGLLAGCSSEEKVIAVNVENEEELSNSALGISALIEIGDYLWYDQGTGIVYFWNGIITNGYSSTTPSPYYAPNGLPYRYNPETNTLEQIKE